MILRVFLCLALMTTGAFAQSGLPQLAQPSQLLGYDAVGRLDREDGSFCSGVLVEPDLVLTAASCLFVEGERVDPATLRFNAGLRNDEVMEQRTGRRAVIMPDFTLDDDDPLRGIRNDLALLELESEIPVGLAPPFELGGSVGRGDVVSVVSVDGRNRQALSRVADCRVSDDWQEVFGFTCERDHGSIGAPVFQRFRSRHRVVSLVTRRFRDSDDIVSFGIAVEPAVAQLRSDLRNGRGVFPEDPVEGRSVTVGGQRGAGGARFVRP